MNDDGIVFTRIVYDTRNASFLNLQFESEVLNVVLLAILTTMFAYQLSAVCLNVSLGSKKKGRATACDMHKLILAESSSPLAVIAAFARNDRIDRLRFGRDLPADVGIARRPSKIKPLTVLSLLVLLLVAPLFNLISIFIVLPRDQITTFKDAKFGGLALSITPIFMNASSLVDSCDQIPVTLLGAATPLARFRLCTEFELDFAIPNTTTVMLTAESTLQGQIKVSVTSLPSRTPTSAAFLMAVATDGKLLNTQPVFTREDAARLIHNGQERLALYCGAALPENSPHIESLLDIEESNEFIVASKEFPCNITNTGNYTDVMLNMTEEINPAEQDKLIVAKVEEFTGDTAPTYTDGGPLPFIARRTRAVNLVLLLMMLGVSIVLRILSGVLFNNDVEAGMEAVVRDRLGIRPHQSLLRSTRTVVYNSKSQRGEIAHYGVRRISIPEVEQFNSGIAVGTSRNGPDKPWG